MCLKNTKSDRKKFPLSSNNDLLLIPRLDLTKYLDLDEIKSNLELGQLSFTLVNPNHEKEEVGEYFVLV